MITTFEKGTMILNAANGECLVAIILLNPESRAVWVEIIPSLNYMPWAIKRGFQALHIMQDAYENKNDIIRGFKAQFQQEWKRSGAASKDKSSWINQYLEFYNTQKPHSALGGKGKRKTPAMAGPYTHLEVTSPEE